MTINKILDNKIQTPGMMTIEQRGNSIKLMVGLYFFYSEAALWRFVATKYWTLTSRDHQTIEIIKKRYMYYEEYSE